MYDLSLRAQRSNPTLQCHCERSEAILHFIKIASSYLLAMTFVVPPRNVDYTVGHCEHSEAILHINKIASSCLLAMTIIQLVIASGAKQSIDRVTLSLSKGSTLLCYSPEV